MSCPQSVSTHWGVARMGLPFSSGGTGQGQTILASSPLHGEQAVLPLRRLASG